MSVGPYGPYGPYGNLSRDCWVLVGNHCTVSAKFRIAATCWQLKTFFESTYNLNIWRDAIEREMWISGLAYAAKAGRRDLLDFFILKGADNWYMGFNNAVLGGHRDLVDFFISKGINYAHAWGLEAAAIGGHRDLVDFFIQKGAAWEAGLYGAALGGHRDLIELSIKNGANDWAIALKHAALGGHPDLVNLFFSKYASADGNDYMDVLRDAMTAAAEGGHVDIINFLFSKMPIQQHRSTLYTIIVKHAAKGGHRNLVELYLSKIEETEGSIDDFTLKSGFMGAISGAHFELMNYFMSKGQNDWDNAAWAACSDGPLAPESLSDAIRHHDMKKFVKSMRHQKALY